LRSCWNVAAQMWSRPRRWLAKAGLAGVALYRSGSYNAGVNGTSDAKVSHRGQTSLPAELRRRWGISEGGEVGFIDLGDAALIVPGGVQAARAELRRVLVERYEVGLASLEDPDLADQQP
jgi:bifunctional DNA-binding transcriptional regulator/antitoxin component of YhaV-PrlF toxin-antitoxin module